MVEVLHYPRLDTVLMIEEAIKSAKDYLSKTELWKSLPKKVMYQTFRMVLDYLEASNKIAYDRDGRIIWVFTDNPKLERLVSSSKRVR